NDLLGSWEQAGVDAFIILTAHGHDPHQEALSTLRTQRARVFTVDVFALDFAGHVEDQDGPMHGSELDTSLLLYLAPQLVRMERAQDFVLPPRQSARHLRTTRPLPELSPGSLGRPTLATREKGEPLRILGQLARGRFTVRLLGRRTERAREFPAAGRVVVLDDSVFALYLFAGWQAGPGAMPVTAIFPRGGRREPLVVQDLGVEAT